MLSQPKTRVQAIKSKFESLNSEKTVKQPSQLYKIKNVNEKRENYESDLSGDENVRPNDSYLYKNDVKRSVSDSKTVLSRQSSDPGKKLHRSHAFRCDRAQISPKRHASCNRHGMDRKLSKDKLKKLGDFLETQMRKENFVPHSNDGVESHINSIPDENVPPHILAQYSKVIKQKKHDEKQDAMTDSGVSSETENFEDDRTNRVKRLTCQFEPNKTEIPLKLDIRTNLDAMEDLAGSSETMKLERKNPHVKLTDTLKKALKQPLPVGPPPKKPPRTFTAPIEEEKKDMQRKLEKLEQVLLKKQTEKKDKNIYDIAEENLNTKPKEMHYLCTEILDITQRTLPNQTSPIKNCLSKLNCSVTNSTISLPYTRLSSNLDAHELSNVTAVKCECQKNCQCQNKSKFYVEEHIYDEPFVEDRIERKVKHRYGTLNSVRDSLSKSLNDLQEKGEVEEQKIYDIPYDTTQESTENEKPVTEFQKLLQNFETGTVAKKTKSFEDLCEASNFAKKPAKFNTEVKRYKPSEVKKNPQLDVDRENLNRLMNEIYDTVTAACNMEENKPGSFPIENTDGVSEESIKLTRSLTEKRKNYVRRVSSRLAYLEPKNIKNTRYRHQTSVCSYKSDVIDNPYSTFRSWKSFRASQHNLTSKMTDAKFDITDSRANELSVKSDVDSDDSFDSSSIDEKAGCVELDLPFEPRENGLFNLCLLVGLNYMTGQAYVKSVFPNQVQVPAHIESLIFPETFSQERGEWTTDASSTQCYSFVLTDERGERSYGYCRRVLPEGATTCLPLCYCIIGKYRAPGLYYKILQEIESHHGSTEIESNVILQQLFETDFPNPGEEITISYTRDTKTNCYTVPCKSMVPCKSTIESKMADNIMDALKTNEDNNNCDYVKDGVVVRTIKRPLEPRADEVSVCTLLDVCGAGLLVKMFATLLLERKLIIRVQNLSCLSRCVESLQSMLYPFVWQQPLICCVPRALRRDLTAAPLPLLAGMLADTDLSLATMDDGMLIDITHPSKVLFYQGDESTILPTNSYKTLKTSLQMESIKNSKDDEKTRNVMISEAFLRFFVDILGDFWRFFSFGVRKEGDLGRGDVVFDKESFIKASTSKQNQYFLEWFTETAMFNHFIQNTAVRYMEINNKKTDDYKMLDTPTPNFYQLFEERVKARTNRSSLDRNGYKSALNKRVKLLKARLKDLVG